MLKIIAQKAKMGTTDYYIAKMTAKDLTDNVNFACELPNWKETPYESRIQREIDTQKVIDVIYPLFIQRKDSFWGSMIISVMSGMSERSFISIKEYLKADNTIEDQLMIDDVGIITLSDDANLIVIDGQHRLLAIKLALHGIDGIPKAVLNMSEEMEREMGKIPIDHEIEYEEISVVLVDGSNRKSIQNLEFHLSR